MIVAVGSLNKTKIEAVRLGFEVVFPGESLTILSFDSPSGVSVQPLSSEEAIDGAVSRANGARVFHQNGGVADFGVGIEAGLQYYRHGWFSLSWAAVVDSAGALGLGSTTSTPVPGKVMSLVERGFELGEACDLAFGLLDIKHCSGFVGTVTSGVLSRMRINTDAVIIALSELLFSRDFCAGISA